MIRKYTADFETSTWEENETWVWAWALCNIQNKKIKIGSDLDEFINCCKEIGNIEVYFHNLKFDGSFILYWALKNGYSYVESVKDAEDMTFTCLISDLGVFYNIVLYHKKGNKTVQKTTFIDSLKIIPFSVDEISKSYNLNISKLDLDYNKPRKKGHKLTKKEKEYIKNDVLIVALALEITFKQGLNKKTRASNALFDFKKGMNYSKFNHYFPVLDYEIDKDIRKAYKGGYTFVNPQYKGQIVYNGSVIDVNSLYPSVMYEKELPFGYPIYYEGKYKNDLMYPLYIQQITCSFKLKKNKLPTIQLKNRLGFLSNEYLDNSNNEIVTLILTNIDLELFFENYDVFELNFICGYKFKSIKGIFNDYIDKWIQVKNDGTLNNNLGLRTTAKLMLNSLYGKFGKSTEMANKIPFLIDDVLHYETTNKNIVDGLYIPIASFITAYAREKTIRTILSVKEYSINKYNKDLFYYTDTDSIHCGLNVEELKKICDIDEIKLGAWKHESTFTKAKFIRQKCYVEIIKDKIHITCSGLPKQCYDSVTFENFKLGFKCKGKLVFKNVKGGVKLVETDFTLKDDKIKNILEKDF